MDRLSELEGFVKAKVNEFTTKLEADPEWRIAVRTHLAQMNLARIVQETCDKLIREMARDGMKTLDYDGKTKKAMAAVTEQAVKVGA